MRSTAQLSARHCCAFLVAVITTQCWNRTVAFSGSVTAIHRSYNGDSHTQCQRTWNSCVRIALAKLPKHNGVRRCLVSPRILFDTSSSSSLYQYNSIVRFAKTDTNDYVNAKSMNDFYSGGTQESTNVVQDNKQSNNKDLLDIESVSDAEALLACHAYLQRRNRLGQWTLAKQRKAQRSVPLDVVNNNDTESLLSRGWFWEDVSQLKYWRHSVNSLQRRTAANATTKDSLDYRWETVNRTAVVQPPSDIGYTDHDTLFDHGPSNERLRRSAAARRTWSDPEWRAKWYQKRWGTIPPRPRNHSRVRQLERRVRHIQPEAFLARPEVAELTEEEIAHAIATYLSLQQRKKVAKQKYQFPVQPATDALDITRDDECNQSTKKLPRDVLLEQSPVDLELARRKRSERAVAAYQTRLKRQQNETGSFVTKHSNASKLINTSHAAALATDTISLSKHPLFATKSTPHTAMRRIVLRLDSNERPFVTDVEAVLQPGRLSGRKALLLRILNDCFDLRGKCVPADMNEHVNDTMTTHGDLDMVKQLSSSMLFATSVPIQQLGAFVVHKLSEKNAPST